MSTRGKGKEIDGTNIKYGVAVAIEKQESYPTTVLTSYFEVIYCDKEEMLTNMCKKYQEIFNRKTDM